MFIWLHEYGLHLSNSIFLDIDKVFFSFTELKIPLRYHFKHLLLLLEIMFISFHEYGRQLSNSVFLDIDKVLFFLSFTEFKIPPFDPSNHS